jgi:hypothetical protein
MCSITFENCCIVFNYYVYGYTHSNCMVVVARAAVAGDPTGACWRPHWSMPTPAEVGRGFLGSLRPLSVCNPSTPPHPASTRPRLQVLLAALGAPRDPTQVRMSCLGLSGAPIGLRKLQGGEGAEALEAPLPSATLPPNRPSTAWPRLQWRATGGRGGPFLAPDSVSVACWGPHRAMLIPGGGRWRPRKPLCPLQSSLPTAHPPLVAKVALVASYWHGGGSKGTILARIGCY